MNKFYSNRFLIASLVLAFAASVAYAQTTAFNYQGRLTDVGNPANGSFQMQFKLFDAVSGGAQIGSTLTDVAVTATNGTFSAKLDFGAVALSGANRWLEIAVRRNSGESYVTLSPREQIASSPYAVRTLSAATADDSQKLGGVAAAEYLTNTSAGTSFIRNQATQQPSSNFNVSGNGVVGGNLGVGTATPSTRLAVFSNFYGISHNDGSVNLSTFLNSQGGWFGTRSNHSLHFYTNDSNPQMTLNTAGQLGVGTTAPLAGYRADFAGGVRAFGDAAHFVANATGGTNSWARFYMRSTNRSWFIGTSQNFIGDQFYLVDETGGQTRMSIQPNGGPINFLGNISQNQAAVGVPKAIIFVVANGTIARCYNGITGSTAGGCGFSIAQPGPNSYTINFGFNVASQYYSLTSSSVSLPGGISPLVGRLGFDPANGNSISASFWRTNDIAPTPSDFTLIVF